MLGFGGDEALFPVPYTGDDPPPVRTSGEISTTPNTPLAADQAMIVKEGGHPVAM
jgi:hypothetical protein